jgi:hypothetical protein
MSQLGQTEKNSMRANVFRFAPESGPCAMQSAVRICANKRLHSLGSNRPGHSLDPSVPDIWSSGRRIALREFSTTFGYGSPLLFTVAIDVHFRIKPTRVIKRSSEYKGETGNTGTVKDDWRSAFWTEASFNELTTIGFVVKCFEHALCRNCRFRNGDEDRKRSSRLFLAILAMAYKSCGICIRGVPNLTAETTANHFAHNVLPRLASLGWQEAVSYAG